MLAGTRQGGKHITCCTTDGLKSARRAGQPSYRGIAPRRCAPAAQPPAAWEVVNVREQGHRRRDHDEAVKMANFSQTRKPAKCDLDKQTRKSLVPGLWLPGSRSEVRYGDAVRESRNSYKL